MCEFRRRRARQTITTLPGLVKVSPCGLNQFRVLEHFVIVPFPDSTHATLTADTVMSNVFTEGAGERTVFLQQRWSVQE